MKQDYSHRNDYNREEEGFPSEENFRNQKSNVYKGEIPIYLKSGPLEIRSCTDVFCLIIFILFTIWSLTLSGFAFYSANPKILETPFDSDRINNFLLLLFLFIFY